MTGRPAVILTDAQRTEVETLAAVLNAEQIADYLGIGRTTFFALLGRDADLSERYKRGKARAVGAVAQSLVTKARSGNVTAMIFYLKTQGGWREAIEVDSRTAMVDVTPPVDALALLTSRLDKIAARIAAARPTGPGTALPEDGGSR
ncbi:hypothetical protein LHP98_05675 [Rhodobacter sp. Har01]|uniref:hypothetical protein n=1 Tax=Rhodobacter sp. Har01 TaxID=2883999 RepID=UPI001D05FB3A|nr:hypothetical protein [Rhodobacter sp. Har01]MCB6177617.1 hypothetical protein [Rhodobacter sp. Har01]